MYSKREQWGHKVHLTRSNELLQPPYDNRSWARAQPSPAQQHAANTADDQHLPTARFLSVLTPPQPHSYHPLLPILEQHSGTQGEMRRHARKLLRSGMLRARAWCPAVLGKQPGQSPAPSTSFSLRDGNAVQTKQDAMSKLSCNDLL